MKVSFVSISGNIQQLPFAKLRCRKQVYVLLNLFLSVFLIFAEVTFKILRTTERSSSLRNRTSSVKFDNHFRNASDSFHTNLLLTQQHQPVLLIYYIVQKCIENKATIYYYFWVACREYT